MRRLPIMEGCQVSTDQAEPKVLAEYLRALPKVELHLHLEGSLSPDLLLKLADRNGVRLPFVHADESERFYRYQSFKDFSNALLLGVSCLRTPEDFHDAIMHLGGGLIEENVRYAEITWTPQFYLKRDFPINVIFEAMNAARRRLEREKGLRLAWIPDIVRSYPQYAIDLARWASSPAGRAAGIVALGLGGPESGYPATSFVQPFKLARDAGLPANPHAGEGAGADSVWDTIRSLKPARLGHGVRSIEDDRLVDFLGQYQIPLEICLTSNIKLGIFPDYETHPVKKLIAAGCTVVLNTDDPVLFNTTLSQEYFLGVTRCGLSIDDIERSILAGIGSSYLAEPEKDMLTQEFRDRFSWLRVELMASNRL